MAGVFNSAHIAGLAAARIKYLFPSEPKHYKIVVCLIKIILRREG